MRALGRFQTPARWWDRVAIASAGWEDCEGFPVASAGWRDPTPEAREKLKEAIRLIARYAPRQFERLGQLMRGVIIARLHTADASWRPNLQACLLDIEYLESDRASIASLASTIIHELTHARLDNLGFTYSKERRARIEHICHRAERRFLSSLPESAERDAAIEAVEERLRFEPSVWTDEAIRARQEWEPWHLRALRFVFRPLPDIDR